MSTYAEFSTAIPTGVNGLAVGAKGSEVTVADSSGNLYQAGTLITATAAILNAVTANVINGVAASKKIAAGTAAFDDLSATIDTGLTTISQVVVSRRNDSKTMTKISNSLDPVFFAAKVSSGNLWIRSFRMTRTTASVGGTPRCNTTTKVASVDWIAYGT